MPRTDRRAQQPRKGWIVFDDNADGVAQTSWRAQTALWAFIVANAAEQAHTKTRDALQQLKANADFERRHFEDGAVHERAYYDYTPIACERIANGVPSIALVARTGTWSDPGLKTYRVKFAQATDLSVRIACEFAPGVPHLPQFMRDPRDESEARRMAADFVRRALIGLDRSRLAKAA